MPRRRTYRQLSTKRRRVPAPPARFAGHLHRVLVVSYRLTLVSLPIYRGSDQGMSLSN